MSMVDLPELCYGGSTGLELVLGGERHLPSEALENRALLYLLIAALEQHRSTYPGMWIEKKPFGFTIHCRQLAAKCIEGFLTEAMALLEPHAAVLHFLDGPMTIEVAPPLDGIKERRCRLLLLTVAQNWRPYSTSVIPPTMASALAVATKLGGIAPGIRPGPSAEATQRLSDPVARSELPSALTLANPFAFHSLNTNNLGGYYEP